MTASSTSRSRARSTTSLLKVCQRRLGSTPSSRTTSRVGPGMRRVVEGVLGPLDPARQALVERDVRPGRLEVEEVLRVDLREPLGVPELSRGSPPRASPPARRRSSPGTQRRAPAAASSGLPTMRSSLIGSVYAGCARARSRARPSTPRRAQPGRRGPARATRAADSATAAPRRAICTTSRREQDSGSGREHARAVAVAVEPDQQHQEREPERRRRADVDVDRVEQIPEALDLGAVARMRAGGRRERAGDDEHRQAPASGRPSSRSHGGAGDSTAARRSPTPRPRRRARWPARRARAGSGADHQRVEVGPDRQQAERRLPDRPEEGEAGEPAGPAGETRRPVRREPGRQREPDREEAMTRFPNSIDECSPTAGKNAPSWQPGQHSQASPEPVSRTAAPLRTIR